jgi:hypothetical protein
MTTQCQIETKITNKERSGGRSSSSIGVTSLDSMVSQGDLHQQAAAAGHKSAAAAEAGRKAALARKKKTKQTTSESKVASADKPSALIKPKESGVKRKHYDNDDRDGDDDSLQQCEEVMRKSKAIIRKPNGKAKSAAKTIAKNDDGGLG